MGCDPVSDFGHASEIDAEIDGYKAFDVAAFGFHDLDAGQAHRVVGDCADKAAMDQSARVTMRLS